MKLNGQCADDIPGPGHGYLMLSLAAGIGALAALATSEFAQSNIPPVLVLVTTLAVLFVHEWRRAGWHAPVNAGLLFLAIVTLYGLYPLTEYAALGGTYTPFNESRLYTMQPLPETVARLGWYYVAYALAFTATYLAVTRRISSKLRVSLRPVSPSTAWAVLVAFITLRALVLVADLVFAAPVSDYLSTYVRYAHLPLLLQQLIGHGAGMLSVLGLALIALACVNWKRNRAWILIWVLIELTSTIISGGSRRELFILVLSLAVAYHCLVRPIGAGVLFLGGLLTVFGFLGLGIHRASQQGDILGSGIELLATANEFDALFANAVDVDRLLGAGLADRSALGAAVYAGDIIAIVPQQLMPFDKVNLSRWYVETFHQSYADRGGGLAFGAIPEALVGAGPVDLLWRAALIGLFLGWLDNTVRKGRVSLQFFVIYVWALTSSYLMFRSTTMALIPAFVYRVLPVLIAVPILSELLRMAGRRSGIGASNAARRRVAEIEDMAASAHRSSSDVRRPRGCE